MFYIAQEDGPRYKIMSQEFMYKNGGEKEHADKSLDHNGREMFPLKENFITPLARK